VLLLTSLASGPKHGYALSKDVEDFCGRHLSPGTLYGAITRLEELGLIEPLEDVERRRPYRLTTNGAQVLRDGDERNAPTRRRGRRATSTRDQGRVMRRRFDARRLLRWYPPSWRARYEEEFLVFLEDRLEDSPLTLRFRMSVTVAGLPRTLLRVGLVEREVPHRPQRRTGSLMVLVAWSIS